MEDNRIFLIFTNFSIFKRIFFVMFFFLKDQSTFGEMMPYDRAQNFEHFFVFTALLENLLRQIIAKNYIFSAFSD